MTKRQKKEMSRNSIETKEENIRAKTKIIKKDKTSKTRRERSKLLEFNKKTNKNINHKESRISLDTDRSERTFSG
jgi:hypothetical protein